MGDDNAPFELLKELEGLLAQPEQLEGEPYGYVHIVLNEHFHLPSIEVFNRSKDLPTNSVGYFPVYLRPITFTPITAKDVTDAMLAHIAMAGEHFDGSGLSVDDCSKAAFAAAVNAWGARK